MKYVHRFGTGSYSAFRVTHADFTGEAFSGPPFEGIVSDDGWLQAALQSGTVALMANRGASHAIWHVTTVGAEGMLASPGDYIVKPDNNDNLYVCHGPLWEMLMEPAVKDEPSLEDKIKEVLRAGAEEIRHSTKIDWSAFMGKLDDAIGAAVPNTRSIGDYYRESISDDVVIIDLSSALSTTVIDDDGNRTTYPAGKQDVFDERLFPIIAVARAEEVVPAIYGREQHHQEKANDIINTLRSMLDNDDVSFYAPQAYQDLNWAKYILLDKAPADLKLITDKCLTLGIVELLPTYGGNEDMTRKGMAQLSVQGILGACEDHYRMGLGQYDRLDMVRWGLAWEKLTTGEPIPHNVEVAAWNDIVELVTEYRNQVVGKLDK